MSFWKIIEWGCRHEDNYAKCVKIMEWAQHDKILPNSKEIRENIKNIDETHKFYKFKQLYKLKKKTLIHIKELIYLLYKVDIDKLMLVIFAYIRKDSELLNKINNFPTYSEIDIDHQIWNFTSAIFSKFNSIN